MAGGHTTIRPRCDSLAVTNTPTGPPEFSSMRTVLKVIGAAAIVTLVG